MRAKCARTVLVIPKVSMLVHIAKCWYTHSSLFLKDNPLIAFIGIVFFTISIAAASIKPQAKIIPVGKEMVSAYKLLNRSETGVDLIKRVKKNAKGYYIYLTLGETEFDNLIGPWGEEARGVTRTKVCKNGMTCLVNQMSVITNKSVTRSRPCEIVKNLAYELENILYVHGGTCRCPGSDSPHARRTQYKIIKELGLTLPEGLI